MASQDRLCRPYWFNTSSNDLVRDLVMARSASDNDRLQQELHQIVTGQGLEMVLDDHIVLRNIRAGDDSLWHLLAMTGYLLKKALKKDRLETKAQEALEQARARDYLTVLRQRGASPLASVGIALRGKDMRVRWMEVTSC